MCLQIICGICGTKSDIWPKTDKEFKELVPDGWFKIDFPKRTGDDRDYDPYRVCSIGCLHKMEQLLEQIKEK